jgi:hypothetical protein
LRSRADLRADIYSLGVILYECLTFRLPFAREGEEAFVVRDEDVPPAFPPEFPPPLRPLVERCLRLRPEDRYASVQELISALGQTARPGDSVRLPLDQPVMSAPVRAAPGPEPREQVPTTTLDRQELRTAAAELARGAVGVARGVWDGVVERVGSARAETPEGQASTAVEGSEVLVVQSLEEPDVTELAPLSPVDAPWRVELRRAREAQAKEASPVRATPLATVPVPPRSEGGLVGSIVQSFVVGTEIMGTLITGPLLALARRTARGVDQAVRGLPGLVGSFVRFGLFLVLMCGIGALCVFVLLATIAFNA